MFVMCYIHYLDAQARQATITQFRSYEKNGEREKVKKHAKNHSQLDILYIHTENPILRRW